MLYLLLLVKVFNGCIFAFSTKKIIAMEITKLTQNLDALMDAFQVHEIKNCQHLQQLLTISPLPLKTSHQEIFDILLEEINDKGDQWNEEELKMKFIAFLFSSPKLKKKEKYKRFMSAL